MSGQLIAVFPMRINELGNLFRFFHSWAHRMGLPVLKKDERGNSPNLILRRNLPQPIAVKFIEVKLRKALAQLVLILFEDFRLNFARMAPLRKKIDKYGPIPSFRMKFLTLNNFVHFVFLLWFLLVSIIRKSDIYKYALSFFSEKLRQTFKYPYCYCTFSFGSVLDTPYSTLPSTAQ